MNNFTTIPNFIITSSLKGTYFKLYCTLESMCFGDKNFCFPSQEYLAKKLGVCVRTIQRGLKVLVQAGLIRIKRRGSISNLYYILSKAVLKNKSNNKDDFKKGKSKGKIGEFNNFKQREYKHEELKGIEKGLLSHMNYDNEEELKE